MPLPLTGSPSLRGRPYGSFLTSFRSCLKCHPGGVSLTIPPLGPPTLLDEEDKKKSAKEMVERSQCSRNKATRADVKWGERCPEVSHRARCCHPGQGHLNSLP